MWVSRALTWLCEEPQGNFTLAWVFADLGNPTIQDHAAEAIHRFTRKS
jgi:hypothetical protein